ncbi:MAG: NUDIX hydrolase [Cenarchaeum symbiont of Oopsacas minuta]|nr:NUDIX hydrolase [Cenarchaeum symbiont of Oopsacas minuta]
MKQIKQTSAGAVIYRDLLDGREYLLLRYLGGHWDFVKGKIETGETLKDTVIRETQEETGICDLVLMDGFEDEIYYRFKHEGTLIEKRVVFYLANTKTKKIVISDEHLDYAWMGMDDALNRLTYDNARFVLYRANKKLSSI